MLRESAIAGRPLKSLLNNEENIFVCGYGNKKVHRLIRLGTSEDFVRKIDTYTHKAAVKLRDGKFQNWSHSAVIEYVIIVCSRHLSLI